MAMELPAWISPGMALFVLLNVLVGAIAVTSRGKLGGPAASGRRLCRSASSMVFDRLRSFSMFSAHTTAEWYHASTEAEELQVTPAAPEPAVLEPATTAPPSSPGAADAAASEPELQEEKSVSLNEAKLHREQPSPSPSPSPPAATAETAAAVEGSGKKEATKRRARAGGREAAEEVLEEKTRLNERAEQFIQQFREDLKLQRLNSIINYTRGLRRFAGAAPAH
ncbi:hypothetical protein ACP70R_000817 [Stipagrostis hirtigluma subsp. patula]